MQSQSPSRIANTLKLLLLPSCWYLVVPTIQVPHHIRVLLSKSTRNNASLITCICTTTHCPLWRIYLTNYCITPLSETQTIDFFWSSRLIPTTSDGDISRTPTPSFWKKNILLRVSGYLKTYHRIPETCPWKSSSKITLIYTCRTDKSEVSSKHKQKSL